jgi:Pilus formation protein N terminal region
MRWLTILVLAVALFVPAFRAEEKPSVQRVTLTCHETLRLEMTTKKNIVQAKVQDEKVVRGPSQLDKPSIELTGLAPGTTRVTLTDGGGKKEAFEVVVQRPRQIVVSVGQTVRLRMSSKKPIAKVFNEKPAIVNISPVDGDPTTIQVTGLSPGIVRITLIDKDGREEVHEAGPPLDKK